MLEGILLFSGLLWFIALTPDPSLASGRGELRLPSPSGRRDGDEGKHIKF